MQASSTMADPSPGTARPPTPPTADAGGVVIVGGGFAGLYTALALAQKPGHPPILLIEPNERFLFLPLLYELLSGELRRWEIAPRYDRLLASQGVAWLRDRVTAIDTSSRRLRTASGLERPYGRLVLATGGQLNTFGVPGAADHAIGFRSLEDVDRLLALIQHLRTHRRPLQRLAIVGAGASGVELACKLADLLDGAASVELIEQGPTALADCRDFNREQGLLALQRRDVRLRTRTRVTAVEADRLLLSPATADQADRQESLSVAAVIWTAGFQVTAPPNSPAPRQDSRGRLLCQSDLRLEGRDDVFVVGDLAAPAAPSSWPATAQVAFQQASCTANNLMRSLAGEPLEPFTWNDLGEMISLGRGDASLTSGGITLAGPAAYQVRRLAYLSRLPGLAHQVRVAAGWLADWQS